MVRSDFSIFRKYSIKSISESSLLADGSAKLVSDSEWNSGKRLNDISKIFQFWT